MINILIVTAGAKYISTQEETWEAAYRWVAAKAKDSWYERLISPESPVFMKDLNADTPMAEFTVESIVRELAEEAST